MLSLTLAGLACRPSHPEPPGGRPMPPLAPADPVAEEPPDDPTTIEGDEIGPDEVDAARLVEPGPADAAVQQHESLETPP